MTGIYGNRCNCYNGHNSNSGRCHDRPIHNGCFCLECVSECEQVEPSAQEKFPIGTWVRLDFDVTSLDVPIAKRFEVAKVIDYADDDVIVKTATACFPIELQLISKAYDIKDVDLVAGGEFPIVSEEN